MSHVRRAPQAKGAVMLQVAGLEKHYGDLLALDGCSLNVPDGRIVGFVGANGAGKTTTMRAVFGLVELDSGSVCWDGGPVGRSERLRFGYMPEERGLYPRMGLAEQLVYFARLHGVPARRAEERTESVLRDLGLESRSGDPVEALSHGNQQRAQLAAALVHDPELLVLDEPFAGLDPLAVEDMIALLRRHAEGGVAVLLSSHQLELVEDICDDVVIIDRGRVLAAGEVQSLRSSDRRRRVEITFHPPVPAAQWDAIPGAEEVSVDRGTVLLLTDPEIDPANVLARAEEVGHVAGFSYGPPTLAELFREKVQR
jgi:ABC-2 type transport system ATP-binding protein